MWKMNESVYYYLVLYIIISLFCLSKCKTNVVTKLIFENPCHTLVRWWCKGIYKILTIGGKKRRKKRRILTQLDSKRFSNNQGMWHTIKTCGIRSRYVTHDQDMWHTIKTCGIWSRHVAYDQNMWHTIKTCGIWSRHVTYDQDIWHTIKTCSIQSRYVAYDQDVFLCCPIMYLYILRSVLWCPLWFLHINDVRFVFTSSYLFNNISFCCCC